MGREAHARSSLLHLHWLGCLLRCFCLLLHDCMLLLLFRLLQG